MDMVLARTFLEIAATGSFAAAAQRLFVTQSAVSLRVRKLEDALGQRLFQRSKSGADLTPAGVAFERYATSLVKIWQEARQQVAVPEGFSASLTIGAQYSLWPRLGYRWLDVLRESLPHVSLRAELGMPDRLTRFLIEGLCHVVLTHAPQARPGLSLRKVLEEELVLVAGWREPRLADLDGRYAFVDWGPEFVHAHALHMPHLTNPGLNLGLGAMAGDFIASRGLAGYLPARAVQPRIGQGDLHLVPDAPTFPYPVWVVWREDLDPDVAMDAFAALDQVTTQVDRDQEELTEALKALSADGELHVLGAET